MLDKFTRILTIFFLIYLLGIGLYLGYQSIFGTTKTFWYYVN